MAIRFVLNGEQRSESSLAPTTVVLDYLRDHAGLTGTKEGCGEGDCGACSIVLVRRDGDAPVLEAVNSCLLVLAQLDGLEVITVEGISGKDGSLDPVQRAMVEGDGTQCGFCTPGFVMAMFTLRNSAEEITDAAIHDALAGNLCRCTGYRSIVGAARAACGEEGSREVAEPPSPGESHRHGGQVFFSPGSLGALVDLRAEHPQARMLAGGTDLGLLFCKERQTPPEIIYTRHVAELRRIDELDDVLEIGAAVTYTEALPQIERLYPSFGNLIRRIGSRQIRNVGTIGGNIANASPIGDTPPGLIALDATLVLYSRESRRELPIEEFFVGYRETALRPGEVVRSVRIPKPRPGQDFRTYKISKRFDQDISSVVGAYRVRVAGGVITDIRIALGGMAAIPKRATAAERALTGAPWSEDSMVSAAAALADDFSPISDHRASSAYRKLVAGNLLVRLYRDLAGAGEPVEVMAW